MENFKLAVLLAAVALCNAQYQPNWDSVDSRPLPAWYDQVKFGIFLHWGVFSVPSIGSEWFWMGWATGDKNINQYMSDNYPPRFTYADFASQFHADLWDPAEWADIFSASGAKYVVLTSKHHEGFTNWRSNVSWNWNAVDVGPKRDLVGDLASAVRNRNIVFGLYHSMMDWFHPLYLLDKSNNFQTQYFPAAKALPELYEIVNAYRPEVIWSDGDWEAPDTYWNATEFLAWLYNSSPVRDTVVVNDRWGVNIPCHHGGYYTCSDKYQPGVLLKHKWESCMSIDQNSWGFRRNMVLSDMLTTQDIVHDLVATVSCNGNLLLNVGPTADGRIAVAFEQRLREVGAWLGVNGEAIYNSTYWTYQNDTKTANIWYTTKNKVVYAFLLNWPASNSIDLGAPLVQASTKVTLLGYGPQLTFTDLKPGVRITLPALTITQVPCDHAWVLRFENLANSKRDDALLAIRGMPKPPIDSRVRRAMQYGNVNSAPVNGGSRPLKYNPKPNDL